MSFSTGDTIVAIATPPGRGGIGVVRVSGPSSGKIAGALLTLAAPLQPRHATFSHALGDQVVATYFPAPHSYTGEDVIEISAHGSPVVLRQIVEQAIQAGARLAEPGEFTLRAFLNGRIDLVQAEAVADLIEAVTPLQARAAFDQLEGTLTGRIGDVDRELFDLTARIEASLDFPDEGYHFVEAGHVAASLRSIERALASLVCESKHGRLIREGASVAITGKPNVGKSSLFNALLRTSRAIVAPSPGTTRDLVTETAEIEGLRIALVDTAGIRVADDEVEAEGVSRARQTWARADLVIAVLDVSERLDERDHELLRDTTETPRLVVANKSDLPRVWTSAEPGLAVVSVSSRTGDGLDELRTEIRSALEGSTAKPKDTVMITNVRHAELVNRARQALQRACESVESPDGPVPEEFVLTDLQEARAALEEVTGKRTSEDLLRHIFSRFC
ncbi:MAG: tRNA uridine-5-carboxymethylaminomethyl(34) synthesis GTPase MnmE, partial [Vicinamibacterales bacterium]|nr:tRNA uridine-5-carboxymethylaminomethyl(34) synthesis GTPase MnmE [Vicinamibacterales bacterium]